MVRSALKGEDKGAAIADKYNIVYDTFKKWVRRYKSGKVLRGKLGRTPLLEVEDKKVLETFVADSALKPTELEFKDKVRVLTEERMNKRLSPSKQHRRNWGKLKTGPSPSALRIIMKELDFHTGNGTTSTNARETAVASKYNTISFIAANSLMVKKSSPPIIINSDFSGINVGKDIHKMEKLVYQGKRKDNISRGKGLKGKSQAKSKGQSENGMGYTIKPYATICAAGGHAAPIYHIKHDSMPPGEVDWQEVNNLGLGPGQSGIVVFSHASTPDKAYYRKFIREILIPYVINQRQLYGIADNVVAWFCEDGEQCQIDVLREPEIVAVLKETNIEVGKSCGSRTEVEQECDAGYVFMGTKTEVDNIMSTPGRFTEVPGLRADLEAVFDRHEATYGKLKSRHRPVAIKGLQVIRQAMEEAFKMRLIIESFALTGKYSQKLGGFDVERALENCTEYFTLEEKQKLWASLIKLQKLWWGHGELFTQDFVDAGFPFDDEQDKDGLILQRRRFVRMLHPDIIAKETTRIQLRDEKAEAAAARKRARGEAQQQAHNAPGEKRQKALDGVCRLVAQMNVMIV